MNLDYGVFIVGMLVRAAVLVLIMTVLALPLLAIVTGMRGLEALWQRVGAVVSVGGLPWKAGLYYAPGHLWVKRRWGTARVGLDGVAQRIVFGARAVELPAAGHKGACRGSRRPRHVRRQARGNHVSGRWRRYGGERGAQSKSVSSPPRTVPGGMAVRSAAGQLRLHLPAAWSFGPELVQCGGRSPEAIP